MFKQQLSHPRPEGFRPVGIVIFAGDPDPEVEQLCLYPALHLSEIFDQVIASSEQAPQMIPLRVGHGNAPQTSIAQLAADEIGIDLIGFLKPGLSGTGDIGRVKDEALPSEGEEGPVGAIAPAAGLVGAEDIMPREVFFHIPVQGIGIGGHGKLLALKQIGRHADAPCGLVHVDTDEQPGLYGIRYFHDR